jgi:hypothetical protein
MRRQNFSVSRCAGLCLYALNGPSSFIIFTADVVFSHGQKLKQERVAHVRQERQLRKELSDAKAKWTQERNKLDKEHSAEKAKWAKEIERERVAARRFQNENAAPPGTPRAFVARRENNPGLSSNNRGMSPMRSYFDFNRPGTPSRRSVDVKESAASLAKLARVASAKMASIKKNGDDVPNDFFDSCEHIL